MTVKARHRHNAILVVPHRLKLLTLLRLAVSAVQVLTETITCTLRPHVSCCSHGVSNSVPRLQVSIRMPTCAPHMVYLLKRHRCDLVCVQLSQSRPHSHMSVPSMWDRLLTGLGCAISPIWTRSRPNASWHPLACGVRTSPPLRAAHRAHERTLNMEQTAPRQELSTTRACRLTFLADSSTGSTVRSP